MADYLDTFQVRNNFISEVDGLTKNQGGSVEGISGCHFPCDLDEYELSIGEGFDGIEFSLFEDKLSVDVPTFRKYLRLACEAYWTEYPDSGQILEEYLSRPQPPLEEGALPLWKEMRDAGKFPKPYSEFE